MTKALIPALKPEEIEVMAQYDQSPAQRDFLGTKLILHVKGSSVAAILDREFGFRWKKETSVIPIGTDHLMKVTLSIKVDGEWVTRDGIGSPNMYGRKIIERPLQDAAKAEETDCLKRAAYEFGLGRELRTNLDLFFPTSYINWKEDRSDGVADRITYDRFVVDQITYDDPDSPNRKITSITISNTNTGKSMTYPNNVVIPVEVPKSEPKTEPKAEPKTEKAEKKAETKEQSLFFIPGGKKEVKPTVSKASSKPEKAKAKPVIIDFGPNKGKDLYEIVERVPSFAYWVYAHAPEGSEGVKAEALKIGKTNPECKKYFEAAGVAI
jgi:hypothetical protein